jgi:hypothetical protein
LIDSIRVSNELDKEQIALLLSVLRDSLTPGAAENADLVERLKRISTDKQSFESVWNRVSPLILRTLKEVIDKAIMGGASE